MSDLTQTRNDTIQEIIGKVKFLTDKVYERTSTHDLGQRIVAYLEGMKYEQERNINQQHNTQRSPKDRRAMGDRRKRKLSPD
jgi:hypothetical protein